MKTKPLKKEYEIQAEHQLSDNEFIGRCGEILQMESTKRMAIRNNEKIKKSIFMVFFKAETI